MKIVLLLLAVWGRIALGECRPVTGNKVFARDLAMVDARYAALPETLVIGYAPTPGSQRVFAAAELDRIGRANGLAFVAVKDICLASPLRQVSREEVAAAMRRALPPDADLRIVELASFGVPAGELEFPVSALEPPVPGTGETRLWRGYVRYADTRRAPFWARVVASMTYSAVVAVHDIQPNKPLGVNDVRVEKLIGLPRGELPLSRPEDLAGRVARVPLKAGSAITRSLLADVPAVLRGDRVRVEVRSGFARLHFDAVAQNPAREGDLIELRNPFNGKTFRARLDPGPSATLVLSGEKL